MGLCCCLSLQKGVAAVGVLSLLAALVVCVADIVAAITFEEHIASCRSGEQRDILSILPACELLTDVSTIFAARVFLYVQTAIWGLQSLFSIFLIISAVKEKGGLMLPWVVLTIVILLAVVYSGVRAALQHKTIELLLCILSIGIASYCLMVTKAYLSYLSPIVPTPTSNIRSISRITPPRRCCSHTHMDDEQGLPDLPPAYSKTLSIKSPLPSGLGIKK